MDTKELSRNLSSSQDDFVKNFEITHEEDLFLFQEDILKEINKGNREFVLSLGLKKDIKCIKELNAIRKYFVIKGLSNGNFYHRDIQKYFYGMLLENKDIPFDIQEKFWIKDYDKLPDDNNIECGISIKIPKSMDEYIGYF
jgi:hypothetical protein